MAATWSVRMCEYYTVGPDGPFEGESRVIHNVYWQCIDEQTVDGNTYRGKIYGSNSLQPFTGGDFVDWSEVTEALVLEWLHEKIGAEGVSSAESRCASDLESKVNPPTGEGVPWSD